MLRDPTGVDGELCATLEAMQTGSSSASSIPAKRLLGVVPGSLVSGAESVLLRDCLAAQRAGWEVRIACSQGPFVQRLANEGVERVSIPDLRLREGNRVIAFGSALINAANAAIKLRRSLRPGELVVANSINVLPATAAVAKSHRVIYFGHDVLIRRDRLALLKALRRRVHLAVAVSDTVARTIRPTGIPTTVIHNGTAWPVAAAPEPAPDAPPVIGIAAVLTPWKGHSVMLEALSLMTHKEAVLEIMGGTPPKETAYADALHQRSQRGDLAGRVAFLGHVDRPLDRMRTWTVVVLPSTDPEAGPLTALEAMSIGVPVVGTDHGGMVEVMGDAELLVPPSDSQALAAALDRLLDDPELQHRCRTAGPQQILAHHLTLADHEAQMLEIFDAQRR